MKNFRTYTRWALVGILLGGVLTSWLSPKVIGWYFDPPVNIGVNCRAATEWAMHKFRLAQLFGMSFGGAAAFLLATLRRKPKALPPNNL